MYHTQIESRSSAQKSSDSAALGCVTESETRPQRTCTGKTTSPLKAQLLTPTHSPCMPKQSAACTIPLSWPRLPSARRSTEFSLLVASQQWSGSVVHRGGVAGQCCAVLYCAVMRVAPNMFFGAKISWWKRSTTHLGAACGCICICPLLPSFSRHLDGHVILIEWMAVSPLGVPNTRYESVFICQNGSLNSMISH